jgi:outer membrane biosynthesis protein TonB
MFASLNPKFRPKQYLTFGASLCLEIALLLVLTIHGLPRMSGPSLRPHQSHPAATDIYFQETSATSSKMEPELADEHHAPEVATKAQPSNSQPETSNDDADSSADSSKIDAPNWTPSDRWSMDAMPASFTVFGHQINTAQPLFTPDPPILHGEVPEPTRGKDLLVEVVINGEGNIVEATVMQGVGYGVENSIMETLRQWTFVPAKVNGVGVPCRRQLVFHLPS